MKVQDKLFESPESHRVNVRHCKTSGLHLVDGRAANGKPKLQIGHQADGAPVTSDVKQTDIGVP